MSAEKELALLQKDFDNYQDSIQLKAEAAVERIVQSLNANEITTNDAFEAMRGLYYGLNGYDKGNYLMYLVNAIESEKVGRSAEVVEVGDYFVMYIAGGTKLHIVQKVREIDAITKQSERKSVFRRVVNYLREKKAK